MTGRTQHAAGLIVVGVDGGKASLAALRWAAQEALLYQDRVHPVFVSLRYRRAWYSGSPEVSPEAEAMLTAGRSRPGRTYGGRPFAAWKATRADLAGRIGGAFCQPPT